MLQRSQKWPVHVFMFLFLSTITYLDSASDTISSGKSLRIGKTLVSAGERFEFGFFTPGESRNYYIGIWYKKSYLGQRFYVWTANRNSPLSYSDSLELKLVEDGNLVLFGGDKKAVWSTNLTSNAIDACEAVFQYDGNLVLRNRIRPSEVYWQSFHHSSSTILPGGRIGYDNRTKRSYVLTSWKAQDDPSEGLFSFEVDPDGDQLITRWNRTETYWRSGAWNGKMFTNAPEMTSNNIFIFSYVKDENGSYFTFRVHNTSFISRMVINWSGQARQLTLNQVTGATFMSSYPRDQCMVYAFCGVYGVCNQYDYSPHCECMKGFQPRSPQEWNKSDFSSSGCARQASLQCGDKDTFFRMSNVILPVNKQPLAAASVDKCKLACVNTCSCNAYAYTNGCSIWNGDLANVTQLAVGDKDGAHLYLRLGASHGPISFTPKKIPNSGGTSMIGISVGIVTTVIVLALAFSYIGLRKRSKRKGSIMTDTKEIVLPSKIETEDLDIPLFDLATIAAATDNFCVSNKIGQGGFGSVYKGILPTGEEVAIKKLSKDSRQGLREFMNEVLVIAKLQHRNLVRLLGCCIQGDERMLIYEYMPNKSLDFSIFDKTISVNLDWEKRTIIIIGIARGLLYLHRDSRLRIIHRDLKAANILLDNHMNPKISDFGMARTFGGDQTEENTMRVVGTYGYMSPEYAIDGVFSMKSDVYSFGVLILEIISGKKNRGFHHADHDLNLLGHAWKLVNDKRAFELMDVSIKDSCKVTEVLKCIQVGLLCVQKFPEDRPSMSLVLSMLESDGTMLPEPKEPGFYIERSHVEKEVPTISDMSISSIEATTTIIEAR